MNVIILHHTDISIRCCPDTITDVRTYIQLNTRVLQQWWPAGV